MERFTLMGVIHNPDGTYRSPKIRSRVNEAVASEKPTEQSISGEIRRIVRSSSSRNDWYLAWGEDDFGSLTFFLFERTSDDFNHISKLLDNSNPNGIKIISRDDSNIALIEYFESRATNPQEEESRELEVLAHLGHPLPSERRFTLTKLIYSQKRVAEIGRLGEVLVATLLKDLAGQGVVHKFSWVNEDVESFLPYDFTITYSSGIECFVDVKTTASSFDQGMVFSNGELSFAARNNYEVFRVSRIDDSPTLRICRNFGATATTLHTHSLTFAKAIEPSDATILSSKIVIRPTLRELVFEEPIDLSIT
jgi:hypothetical protein